MTFAERTVNDILLAMNRAKMSQRILAAHLGVTEARVSQMLRPSSNMRMDTIDRIYAAIAASTPTDH